LLLEGQSTLAGHIFCFIFRSDKFVHLISEMTATILRFEDRLDGASNFFPWKVRVTLLLEENDLRDIVKDVVPSSTDP
jgi:hypothetical protein